MRRRTARTAKKRCALTSGRSSPRLTTKPTDKPRVRQRDCTDQTALLIGKSNSCLRSPHRMHFVGVRWGPQLTELLTENAAARL